MHRYWCKQAKREDLERLQGLLFNGGVEACDGTSVVLTPYLYTTQIGVSLSHTMVIKAGTSPFRRDLRQKYQTQRICHCPTAKRDIRNGSEKPPRRGVAQAFAERAILKINTSTL
jgi:hypothetical protein